MIKPRALSKGKTMEQRVDAGSAQTNHPATRVQGTVVVTTSVAPEFHDELIRLSNPAALSERITSCQATSTTGTGARHVSKRGGEQELMPGTPTLVPSPYSHSIMPTWGADDR